MTHTKEDLNAAKEYTNHVTFGGMGSVVIENAFLAGRTSLREEYEAKAWKELEISQNALIESERENVEMH